MSEFTRRRFLKATAAGAAMSFAVPQVSASGRVRGANDTIRAAVAGINGQGRSHMNSLAGMNGVDVVCLVDPDSRLFESRSQMIEERGGNRPQCVQDIREALDDANIDVVSIASTNHTHALITVWACQAGKDVYVEKPCSHNVFEGRKCVEAARKYGRIVQHGTQNRSSGSWARAVAAAQSGAYGKLLVSYGYASKQRNSIGYRAPEPVPAGLDYDLWLGPAQEEPFHRNLVHYNWHWFWNYGNGEIGNQGVHEMDKARWGIAGATLPKRVYSLGERLGYEDQGETPNTQFTVLDFGEAKIFFEVSGLTKFSVDNEFYCEEGVIRGGRFFPKGSNEGEPLVDVEYTLHGGGAFGNFINCVRSRNQEELNADILEGHYSSALCHLGNISYRLGEDVPFGAESAVFGNDTFARESFEELVEALREYGVDFAGKTCRVGRHLEFDAATERFVGDEEANALLTRDYRAPYVVPDEV